MGNNKERKPKNNGCIFSIVFFLGLVALAIVLDSKEAVQLFGVIPLFIAAKISKIIPKTFIVLNFLIDVYINFLIPR